MPNRNTRPLDVSRLTGERDDKTFDERHFPVRSLEDMLTEIRRVGGTGKLEINFRDGHARGEAKWRGFLRDGT